MKYYHPDFKNYVIDEDDRRSWWSREKEKADLQGEYDRKVAKRGIWFTYGGIAIAILYLSVIMSYLIFGGATKIDMYLYAFLFVCWVFLAALNYYEYKKARSRVAAVKNAG